MPFLYFELLGQLDALGQSADPRVDAESLGLQLLALFPQVLQGYVEDLDELVLFQLGLEVLVLGKAHVDGNMDHSEIGVAESGICIFLVPGNGVHVSRGVSSGGVAGPRMGVTNWATDHST